MSDVVVIVSDDGPPIVQDGGSSPTVLTQPDGAVIAGPSGNTGSPIVTSGGDDDPTILVTGAAGGEGGTLPSPANVIEVAEDGVLEDTTIGRLNFTGGRVQVDVAGEIATVTILDHELFSGSINGLVPASPGGDDHYLRADGVWAIPPIGTGGGGGPTTVDWGEIGGSITAQSDLVSALSAKENSITAGTVAQYWRGDKSWQTLNKVAVGLSNVDNTSDDNKPISSATATALASKAGNGAITGSGLTMTSARMLGRVSASTGAIEELTAAGVKSFLSLVAGDISGLAAIATSGSGADLAAASVTLGKVATQSAGTILGNNTGGAASPIALTAAQVKTMLAIGAADVSGLAAIATSGSGADLGAASVTLGKVATQSAGTILGNNTAGAASPIALTAAQVKSLLAITTADVSGLGTGAGLTSDTDTTLAANSDTRVATQKATKAYVDNAVAGLLDLKGDFNASANPNYPAALKGDAYHINVAGRIGGASGKQVDVGDMVVAKADNAGGTEASVGTSWYVVEHNLTGALLAANNLSDLSNTTTARTNIGLGNVDNTSDANKPVSTATATALAGKEASIAAGTTGQYWRGDKSWQTLDKSAVGLANVDNTSDANKPVSTATQTALNAKQAGDATLTAFAGVTWVAGTQIPVLTAADTFALRTVGAASASDILDRAAGDARYQLTGSFQAADATLTALAGLVWTAGKQIPVFTAVDTVSFLTVGQAAGNLIDKAAGDALYRPITYTPAYTEVGNVPTGTVLYRKTAGTGAAEAQTLATLKTDLGLSGTNSGDQDLSSYATTTALTTGLSGKEPTIAAGTTAQYWRGDKTWQTLGSAGLLASDTDTTLAANSDLKIATQKAVKAYVDGSVKYQPQISTYVPETFSHYITSLPTNFKAEAIGDGATDDLGALNKAITALNSGQISALEIPPGTYKLSAAPTNSITRNGATIVGWGKRRSVFKPQGNFNCLSFVSTSPTTTRISDLTVGNIGIDQGDVSAPTAGLMLRLSRVDRSQFFGIDIRSAFQGFKIEGGTDNSFVDFNSYGAFSWTALAVGSFIGLFTFYPGTTEVPSEMTFTDPKWKGAINGGQCWLDKAIEIQCADQLKIEGGHSGFANTNLWKINAQANAALSILNVTLNDHYIDGSSLGSVNGIAFEISGSTLPMVEGINLVGGGQLRNFAGLGFKSTLTQLRLLTIADQQFSDIGKEMLWLAGTQQFDIHDNTFIRGNTNNTNPKQAIFSACSQGQIHHNNMLGGINAHSVGMEFSSTSTDINYTDNLFATSTTTPVTIDGTSQRLNHKNNKKIGGKPSVASVDGFTLPLGFDKVLVTGTANMSSINAPNIEDYEVELEFASTASMNDNLGNVNLTGAFAATAGSTLRLKNNGSSKWNETGRSII